MIRVLFIVERSSDLWKIQNHARLPVTGSSTDYPSNTLECSQKYFSTILLDFHFFHEAIAEHQNAGKLWWFLWGKKIQLITYSKKKKYRLFLYGFDIDSEDSNEETESFINTRFRFV
jgi:hypothetical protein